MDRKDVKVDLDMQRTVLQMRWPIGSSSAATIQGHCSLQSTRVERSWRTA